MSGKSLQEYWSDFKKRAEKRRIGGKPEYPIGINFIDNLTDGIHKGQIWTLAGKSGSGKTSLALQIARNIADNPNNSVLFISLEMQGEDIVGRMFCEMMKEINTEVNKGIYDKSKEESFTKYISGIDFEIVEQGYTFEDLLKIIQSYYTTKKPDLIVIDFAQLMEWRQDQRLDMERYMRKLTELAKVDSIAIILVSQIRRLPTGADINREPDMSDLKGTGMLEQMSHVVLIIYKYIENYQEHYILKVAKNRSGAIGQEEVEFIGKEYRFEELK